MWYLPFYKMFDSRFILKLLLYKRLAILIYYIHSGIHKLLFLDVFDFLGPLQVYQTGPVCIF